MHMISGGTAASSSARVDDGVLRRTGMCVSRHVCCLTYDASFHCPVQLGARPLSTVFQPRRRDRDREKDVVARGARGQEEGAHRQPLDDSNLKYVVPDDDTVGHFSNGFKSESFQPATAPRARIGSTLSRMTKIVSFGNLLGGEVVAFVSARVIARRDLLARS